MQKEVVHTNDAPAAIGPYSQGISSGNLIFVSGQLGIDPTTGNLKAGIQEQAIQSLKNLKAILEESGSSMKSVLKTTVFLSDMNDFALVNEIYGQYFEEPFPARSAIEVTKLPKQGLVEIEAIAVKL